MKKLIALSLILLAIGAMAFADDAKVMPGMVGRLYVAPNFTFASRLFDDDGERTDKFDDSVKVFNLGFALEFGVIDWITAAVQWVPGWTPWSDLEGASGLKDSNTNGVADIFVGAKIQIIGPKAPVANDTFRLAVAPGVIIPLPGPDFEDEAKNALAGKKATVHSMDNHVFGAGARFMFDWQITDSFFINLFNESIFYIGKRAWEKTGPEEAGTLAVLKDTLETYGVPHSLTKKLGGEVDYKYKLTFELEPVFTTSIADGVSFTAGLPVRYVFKPAEEYSFSGISSLPPAFQSTAESYLSAKGVVSHILYVNPNVSFFLTKTPLPLEFKLQYNFPVWGKNAQVAHTIALQIKAYFALPGADI